MAKAYISGRDYFPGGPQPSTGYGDVQMVENIDLIFGDNEELKFGDGPDAILAWDGTDLTLDVAVGSVVLTSTHGAISGEEHSLDIVSTATLSSGDSLVGLNVAITPSGSAGSWASAIFGKVTEVAAAPGPVGGYFCGAEFEVNITGSQPSAYAVLVLNSNADNSTYGQNEAYIWLREYGSKAVRTFVEFKDHARASADNDVIVSQTTDKPYDTMIRCSIGAAGTTPLWLLASSVGPATAGIESGSVVHILNQAPQAFKYECNLTAQQGAWVHGMKVEVTRAANVQPATGGWFGAQFVLNAGSAGYDALDKSAYALQAVFKGSDTNPNGVDIHVARFETQSAGKVSDICYITANSGTTIVGSLLYLATHVAPGNAMALLNVQSSQTVGKGLAFLAGSGSTLTSLLYCSGDGTFTNFLEVAATGDGGVTVGSDGMNRDPQTHTEDGFITIKVGSTSYEIPFYVAA